MNRKSTGLVSFLCLILYVGELFEMCECSSSNLMRLLRRRRALVYPDPRESQTKVQVLFGLGLPMEGEVSMTLGYVLKCNYNLPYNSSQYTMGATEFDTAKAAAPIETTAEVTNKEKEKQLSRAKNGLIAMSRWSLYRMLESLLDRSCLLRSVCEAAEKPFGSGISGLMGELLHVLLTPTTTNEEYEIYQDREYHTAEAYGRAGPHGCRRFYRDCPYSPLEYFTRIDDF